ILEMCRVNAVAPLVLTRALLPMMQQSASIGQRTLIVNIGSRMASGGNVNGWPGHYGYRTSKAGLHQFTRALAADLFEQQKIEVTAVHPGWIKSDMGGAKA